MNSYLEKRLLVKNNNIIIYIFYYKGWSGRGTDWKFSVPLSTFFNKYKNICMLFSLQRFNNNNVYLLFLYFCKLISQHVRGDLN